MTLTRLLTRHIAPEDRVMAMQAVLDAGERMVQSHWEDINGNGCVVTTIVRAFKPDFKHIPEADARVRCAEVLGVKTEVINQAYRDWDRMDKDEIPRFLARVKSEMEDFLRQNPQYRQSPTTTRRREQMTV